ncbi:hypothetical protein BDW68DRAFT_145255 [Aspergillus falconensis]
MDKGADEGGEERRGEEKEQIYKAMRVTQEGYRKPKRKARKPREDPDESVVCREQHGTLPRCAEPWLGVDPFSVGDRQQQRGDKER